MILSYTFIIIMVAYNIPTCHSFTRSICAHHVHNTYSIQRHLFSELVSNDDEDLRPDICMIEKQSGLDKFLNRDDRMCVIKLYAPYCKACKAFGVKFRKLAIDRGDGVNAMGQTVRIGDARFGDLEYSSNVKLCKDLAVKAFPTVLIYHNGKRLREVRCKSNAIQQIESEMDQLIVDISREWKMK